MSNPKVKECMDDFNTWRIMIHLIWIKLGNTYYATTESNSVIDILVVY